MQEKSRNDSSNNQEEDLDYSLGLIREINSRLNKRDDEANQLVHILRDWLTTISQAEKAFEIARMLPVEDISSLIPSLLRWTYSERFYQKVCRLLGQLPFEEAKEIIPAQIDILLNNETADWWDYWQFASLLKYLGFHDEVCRIAERAHNNSDPEIKDMGDSIHEDLIK